MTTTANTIFQAFIEAQKAMDELPAVEAELAKTKSELETTHRAWDESELKAMSLEDELKALRATLATKEEALAAATFREQEVAHKLAVIQSVIGLPKQSEPVVVPVVAPLAAEGRTETSEGGEKGQGAEGPTGTGNGSEMNSQFATDVSAQGQGDMGPTHVANEQVSQTSAETASGSVAVERGADPTSDQRDADPTQDHSVGLTGNQSHGADQSTAPSPVNTETSDHVGKANRRPYWRKPSDQSWADWTAAGNEPAPWLDREHNDPHTIAAK